MIFHRSALVLWMVAAAGTAVALDTTPFVQSAVQAYREGRYMDALRDMSLVIEENPSDGAAKNYVWTIAKKMAEEDVQLILRPGELSRAAELAEKDLTERRRRTEEVLAALKAVSIRSDRPRGPADLLSSVAGIERYLSPEFEAERTNAQAQAYFKNIVDNLAEALRKKTFVTPKDTFRAQGYLAYVRRDFDTAADFWLRASKEDPSDKALVSDLAALTAFIAKMREERELTNLAKQAEVSLKTGYAEDALENWDAILRIRPDFPAAKEKRMVAKVAAERGRREQILRKKTEEGVDEFKTGRHLKAAQIWLEVLQEDPSNTQARSWLKLVGPRLEEEEKTVALSRTSSATVSAGSTLSGVSGKDPSAPDLLQADEFYKKGLLLYSDDKLEEAVIAWKESLRCNPTMSKAAKALEHAERELAFR